MATRHLLPAFALLALVGCGGGGDDAGLKQEALGPAGEIAAAAATPAPAPAPSDSAAAAAPAPVTPVATAPAANATVTPTSEENHSLGRESFSYTGGSRDPFISLLSSTRVGPELPDLSLVGIYYDTRSPGNSVIVLREKVSGKRHNLRPGDRIGRIRVSSVRPKDVTFIIDDFGTERQETLTLRKQEDTP